MNVLLVAYQIAAVCKRWPVRRAEQRMFAAVTGLLTYALLDGWGVSRLSGRPLPFYLWAGLAGFLMWMLGDVYFELQRTFATLAKARAERRAHRASNKGEEP
jgi:hypothetical protein